MLIEKVEDVNPIVLEVIAEVAQFFAEDIDLELLLWGELEVAVKLRVVALGLVANHVFELVHIGVMHEVLDYLEAFLLGYVVDFRQKQEEGADPEEVGDRFAVVLDAANQDALHLGIVLGE